MFINILKRYQVNKCRVGLYYIKLELQESFGEIEGILFIRYSRERIKKDIKIRCWFFIQ